MLINGDGAQQEVSCFEKESSTSAYKACSISWKNQLFIFGGDEQQISRLDGHKLKRIGTLPFEHLLGACSVMADEIFLCFNIGNDKKDTKKCRKSAGPLEPFVKIPNSNHDHRQTSTSSSQSTFLTARSI